VTNYHDEEDPQHHRVDAALWRRILVHAKPFTGATAGLVLIGIVLAATHVALPWITGAVINNAIFERGNRLWLYAVLYVSIVVFMACLVQCFIRLAGTLATGVAYNLRRAAFAHLQQLSFSYYDNRPAGWLMARMTSDCDRISDILPWALLDGVWGTAFMSGIAGVMFWMNWRLALAVLSIVPPLSLITVVYQQRLVRSQRRARSVNSRITAAFNEGITGVRTTKAFVREEENLREFRIRTQEMFGHSLRNALYGAVYLPIAISLGATGVALAMWRGGLLSLGGRLPFGDLVVFMQYAGLFHIPIQELAERFTGLQAAQVSAERLQSLLDAEPDIRDSPDVPTLAEARIREVAFERVRFAYKKGEQVLWDFDLKIGTGESVALVGETGSGKSTVAKLLCRFYEPVEGTVYINGVDYRQRSLHWLQSNIGVVLQEPHLFSGTILENIRYGRLNASDAEVKAVARTVGASRFIENFADGYRTEVGEGGNRLSTGQKQLIALARALLANPQILVLDEATSSVDTETEREIQAAIEAVLKGRISLIIAHRLSTIRSATRILVLDHGRVVEEGTHSNLLQRAGPYARLYSQQFRIHADAGS
jgi:ATP-binding cassette subfamily B protein